jgi:hypothetical protein
MLRFNKNYLVMALLAGCISHVYTIEWNIIDRWQIDHDDYNSLKTAVFAKKGEAYTTSFNQLYPKSSKESVIALSKEFDAGSCQTWLESYPPQSYAYINGQEFGIHGAIAIIIYDNQNS